MTPAATRTGKLSTATGLILVLGALCVLFALVISRVIYNTARNADSVSVILLVVVPTVFVILVLLVVISSRRYLIWIKWDGHYVTHGRLFSKHVRRIRWREFTRITLYCDQPESLGPRQVRYVIRLELGVAEQFSFSSRHFTLRAAQRFLRAAEACASVEVESKRLMGLPDEDTCGPGTAPK